MRKLGILFCVLFVLGCARTEPPEISFYHWKSNWNPTDFEYEYLNKLSVKKLYVRYFDIDINNGEPEPVGDLIFSDSLAANFQIIPTVFITEKTFRDISKEKISDLAGKVVNRLKSKHEKFSSQPLNSVQFDCDWTLGSKDNYFFFLEKCKELSSWEISSTIRLHQVKFKRKTGVPPVDYGVLMVYNTGNISKWEEENSILKAETVSDYLPKKNDYDIPLDMALPLFSWSLLFREGKLIKIIRDTRLDEFNDTSKYIVKENRVEVKKSHYLKGYYLYSGDELRTESSDRSEILNTVSLLSGVFEPSEIVYYHLDSSTIKPYPHAELENHRLLFSDDNAYRPQPD